MTEQTNNDFMDIGISLTTEAVEAASTVHVQLRLYDIFIPLLGIFIILLNLLVVISSGIILKKGQQPRSTYLFLGNVALSDLVTGIAVIFGQYYPREYRDEYSCAIQIGLIVSSTLASVYSVGLIGLDRYLYILYGLQYQRYIYPNRARCLIAVTWILGIIVGFLPAMGWRGDTDNGRICWFILLAPPGLVLLTTIIGLLPILLVVVLYSIILYRALKKVNQLNKARGEHGAQEGGMRVFTGRSHPNELNANVSDTEQPLQNQRKLFRFFRRTKPTNSNQKTSRAPSKWKAIKVVLFTTLSFVFTWMPFFIASTWFVHCDTEATPDLCKNLALAIAGPLAILGFANSLINPVIYAWWHNGFRQSVKELYQRYCCCCKKKNESITATDSNPLADSSTQNTNVQSSNGVSSIEIN